MFSSCLSKNSKPVTRLEPEPNFAHLSPEEMSIMKVRLMGTELMRCFGDEEILRFLKANTFNLPKAYRALLKHRDWVNEYKPSFILMRFVASPMKMGVWRLLGLDKMSRPIVLVRMGLFAVQPEFSLEDYVLMTVWYMQQLVYMMAKSCTSSCLCVFDLHGWRPSHALFNKYFLKSVEVVKLHYPFVLAKMFAIRPPWIFHQAFQAFRGSFDDDRLTFVQNPDLGRVLLEHIDEQVLPILYGGKARMPGVPNVPGIENLVEEDTPTLADSTDVTSEELEARKSLKWS
eukprot:c25278_g1_i1.p1 GENE.c25278_g1_i1~~c25278_g1_i1.p1  ORF type:complete len:287 (-),score=68.73 c25278_g1_i1:155-1015(-)